MCDQNYVRLSCLFWLEAHGTSGTVTKLKPCLIHGVTKKDQNDDSPRTPEHCLVQAPAAQALFNCHVCSAL